MVRSSVGLLWPLVSMHIAVGDFWLRLQPPLLPFYEVASRWQPCACAVIKIGVQAGYLRGKYMSWIWLPQHSARYNRRYLPQAEQPSSPSASWPVRRFEWAGESTHRYITTLGASDGSSSSVVPTSYIDCELEVCTPNA